MKKTILISLVFLLVAVMPCFAQCVGEVKDVVQDDVRGSIVVQTEYTLNGKVVQLGETRYLETSGTNEEIIAQAKEDIAIHCENLIRRIEANQNYRKAEELKVRKALTQHIIDRIKPSLVGYKTTKTEAEDTFKDKKIKVTYDEKNTVSDIVAVDVIK